MEKKFYEEKTGAYTLSIEAAKRVALKKGIKYPYIYRVWMDNDKILGKSLLLAYGDRVSTIKQADEEIAAKCNYGK